MICERCGAYVDNNALVCDKCGTLQSRKKTTPGGDGLRQGRTNPGVPRPAPSAQGQIEKVYGTEEFDERTGLPGKRSDSMRSNRSAHSRKHRAYERDAGRPNMQRGVPAVTDSVHLPPLQSRSKAVNPVSGRGVNWAKVVLIMFLAAMVVVVGVYFYLQKTPQGQIILARQNKATDSQAYWVVGEEYLNQGYIAKSVETFEYARELDSQKEPAVDNIDGLLLLGAAYEADARLEDAGKLYTELYERIVPSRAEPYRNMIRLLLDQQFDREAGELMQLAFEKTGVLTFRQQRTDLLPKTPETNLAAGRYSQFKSLEFTSPQGYDIYYSTDLEAKIQDEGVGTLYTGPIELTEGTVSFKVVCKSGRLVSDPLTVSYAVYLPSPSSPKSRLASGTYKRRITIYLYMTDPKEATELYYTLDGSEPNVEDSPRYTDAGIVPPSGNVILKAIAVNDLGKVSNSSSVSYKFDVKPYQQPVYDKTDLFGGFELLKTDLPTFEAQYGKGGDETTETIRGFDEECRRIAYPWGSILVGRDRTKKNWLLLEVDTNKELCDLPRGIRFGDSAQSVMDKFRDSTQPAGKNGNRGLYYSDSGVGRYYYLSEGSGIVRYTCKHTDGNTLTVEFYTTNNVITRVKTWYSYG